MKRMWTIVLLSGALAMTAGCDELEELTIELGGWGVPYVGGYGDPGPYYSEEVWVEEEYMVEEVYYEDPWYDDGYYW